jgi:hypothetical protein
MQIEVRFCVVVQRYQIDSLREAPTGAYLQ